MVDSFYSKFGEEEARKIVQALCVVFGAEKVVRYATVELIQLDAEDKTLKSKPPLAVVLSALLRSDFRDVVREVALSS